LADPAYGGLSADEIANGLKHATEAVENWPKKAVAITLAANHKTFDNINGLVLTNSPQAPGAIYSEIRNQDAMLAAHTAEYKRDPAAMAYFQAEHDLTVAALDHAETLYFKHQQEQSGNVDEKIKSELLATHESLFKPGVVPDNTFLRKSLDLRRAVLLAASKGQIPYQTFKLIDQDISNRYSAKDIIGHQTPDQAGYDLLNQMFAKGNGAYRHATQKQKNDARELYMQKVTDANKAGMNLDAMAANEMARMSLNAATLRMAREAADTVLP